MSRHIAPAAAIFVITLMTAADATAQMHQTFVSASGGSDLNPCTEERPCRTIGQALRATGAGGEVTVIGAGGFPPFSVDRSISVRSRVSAVVTAGSSQTAIWIAAPEDARVFVEGFVLTGADGRHGVLALTGASVHLTDLRITGFTNGVQASMPGTVHLRELVVSNNQTGLSSTSEAFVIAKNSAFDGNGWGGTLLRGDATFSGCTFDANSYGLFVEAARVTVSDSRAVANTQSGIHAQRSASVMADRVVSSHNARGIGGTADSQVDLASSTIVFNQQGIATVTVNSRGDNTFRGNVYGNQPGGSYAPR